MRVVKRNRYYCEFCKKSGASGGHIRRHERGCTANPERACGVCKPRDGTHGNLSPAALVAILDADGFRALCEAAGYCPACMLSAIRQRNARDAETGEWYVAGPKDGRENWSYADAKREWWDAVNEHDHY